MAFEFKLPDIGEGVHEGEISKWLVEPGQSVTEDQPMVEVMTDKVTVEITSPVNGVVEELLYKEGDVVKVGSIIIRIDDSATSGAKPASNEAAATNGSAAAKEVHSEAPPVSSRPVATAPLPSAGGRHRTLAAPAVRKLARTMGIDLALVSGSGPGGRVRKQDLMAFSSGGGMAAPQQARPTFQRSSIIAGQGEERIPFRGMRRKIGEHLVKSKQTAPHFTYVEEADMSEIVKFRNDLQPMAEAMGLKLTFLPFIIKAVIEGLKKFPKLNSSLDEATQEIVLKQYYNIGVAVATDEGLIVPVVKHADQRSVLDLAVEIVELSDKARQGKLALTDLQGGTFTLTSIGSIGGIFSAPIVNYPEVGIMGIQKIEKRPVVRNDEIVIREMTYLSISCDHRVVDGAEAALFMKEVIDWLEHPARFLLTP